MFLLLLCLPKERAFSSVGRASPLQGEGQKFESSNAHHKKRTQMGSFFMVCVLMTRNLFGSSADLRTDGVKRIRIARKLSVLQQSCKSETFRAWSKSKRSLLTPTTKKTVTCVNVFLVL